MAKSMGISAGAPSKRTSNSGSKACTRSLSKGTFIGAETTIKVGHIRRCSMIG
jgi:hypothetical protein